MGSSFVPLSPEVRPRSSEPIGLRARCREGEPAQQGGALPAERRLPEGGERLEGLREVVGVSGAGRGAPAPDPGGCFPPAAPAGLPAHPPGGAVTRGFLSGCRAHCQAVHRGLLGGLPALHLRASLPLPQRPAATPLPGVGRRPPLALPRTPTPSSPVLPLVGPGDGQLSAELGLQPLRAGAGLGRGLTSEDLARAPRLPVQGLGPELGWPARGRLLWASPHLGLWMDGAAGQPASVPGSWRGRRWSRFLSWLPRCLKV